MTVAAETMPERPALAMQRSHGVGRLAVKAAAGRTRLARLHQSANARIRIPRTYGSALEAVLINTAGGIAGGDTLSWSIEAGAGTETVVTTQACERVYRSTGDTAAQTTRIEVGEDATLFWLPQETIVFDRGRLARSLDVSLAPGARFVALETIVFGREAMGETVGQAFLHDRWRIHGAEGGLVHADDTRFDFDDPGDPAASAVLGENRVYATVVVVSSDDEEVRRTTVNEIRRNVDEASAGATNVAGRIVIRLSASSSYVMRKRLAGALAPILRETPLPKVWRL